MTLPHDDRAAAVVPAPRPDLASSDVVHLRRDGTSLVLRLDHDDLPCVLHWGADLGDLSDADLAAVLTGLRMPYVDSLVMSQEVVSLLPRHSGGWVGRPGLLGSRDGRAWSVAFDAVTHHLEDTGAGGVLLRSVATDTPGELEVTTRSSCSSAVLPGSARLWWPPTAATRSTGSRPSTTR